MQVRPPADTEVVNDTVPVNPLMDVTVIVELPVAPVTPAIETIVGLAVRR